MQLSGDNSCRGHQLKRQNGKSCQHRRSFCRSTLVASARGCNSILVCTSLHEQHALVVHAFAPMVPRLEDSLGPGHASVTHALVAAGVPVVGTSPCRRRGHPSCCGDSGCTGKAEDKRKIPILVASAWDGFKVFSIDFLQVYWMESVLTPETLGHNNILEQCGGMALECVNALNFQKILV